MIVLVRHAATEEGAGRCIGRTQLSLSAQGVEQARALGHTLAASSWSRLISSPLQRALDTAAPLAKVLGVDVTAMAAFNEIAMGTWDGLPFEMIRSNDPASYEARGRHFGSFRVPGGESFEDVADRAVRALKVLVTEKDPLLVFTHAGVIRATVCRLIGHPMNELFDIPAGNVRCTLIDGAHGELTVVATNVDPADISSLIAES